MDKRITCLIFDFDGVIANTDLGRYKILKQLLDKYDSQLAATFNQKDLLGLSTKGFLIKHSKNLSNGKIEKIIQKRHEMFFSNLAEFCIPYDDMIETIKYFSLKYDLAIATTNEKNNVKTQLDFLEISDCFKWIMGRDVTENEKFEKNYHRVSQIIGRDTDECVVIEDSDFGVNAAIKEGFYCIRFDPDDLFMKGLENDKAYNYKELKAKIEKNTTRQ